MLPTALSLAPPPAMTTIPAPIGTAPALRLLNARVPGPPRTPPLVLSCRVPHLVRLSSVIVAAFGGTGGAGGGAAATVVGATAVITVTAIITGIALISKGTINSVSSIMIMTVIVRDGDVAMDGRHVGWDSLPLFAFFPRARAPLQKVPHGRNPHPPLLSWKVDHVHHRILGGDTAAAAQVGNRRAKGGAGEEGGAGRKAGKEGSGEGGSVSVPSEARSSPGPFLIDAVPVVAVGRVSLVSNQSAVGSAAAQAVDVKGRLGARRDIPRSAKAFGGEGMTGWWHPLTTVTIP